jgi:hypothetical protein
LRRPEPPRSLLKATRVPSGGTAGKVSVVPPGNRVAAANRCARPDEHVGLPNVDGNQCAVHSSFTQAGQPVAYAAIPYPAAPERIVEPTPMLDPNHDIPLDTELIAETTFISAMTVDPLGTAWYTDNPLTGEINCFGSVYVRPPQLGVSPCPC